MVMRMDLEVVKITKKGQATIPKHLRVKFGLKDRAIVRESEKGILFLPFPDISEEKGSLRELFKGQKAKDVVEEARKEDQSKEKNLEIR
ncbi:MAG: AbrB/MazE/SpoVT family DNA-binding domain-containing protein [Methanophagales archaeon ANME-1-THS]|nr:MAG: AbrB/MazE/SpoVT family DNA-binding domain-containing protein [Methanophagales archaeon ANME-1-THS]